MIVFQKWMCYSKFIPNYQVLIVRMTVQRNKFRCCKMGRTSGTNRRKRYHKMWGSLAWNLSMILPFTY